MIEASKSWITSRLNFTDLVVLGAVVMGVAFALNLAPGLGREPEWWFSVADAYTVGGGVTLLVTGVKQTLARSLAWAVVGAAVLMVLLVAAPTQWLLAFVVAGCWAQSWRATRGTEHHRDR